MAGKVTVSLDFELGWGAIETGLWKPREVKGVYTDLRPIMSRLTTLLDDLELNLTWATVGAMISNPAPEDFDHIPPQLAQAARGFLADAAPTSRDGRDLYEMVAGTRTPQDIGSHTFSHTRFSIKDYTFEQKDADIAKSVQSLQDYGVTPHSFVFPLNHCSDHEVLAKNNISVGRTTPIEPKGRLGKLGKRLMGRANTAQRSVCLPGYDVESGSMLYNWGTALDWRLRQALTEHQLTQSLKKAKEGAFHLHVWLHPFNLAEVNGLEKGFTAFLTKVAHLRDAGHVDVKPMTSV